MDEESYECLGLLYGDGCLKGKLSFSNSEPSIVNKVYRFIRRSVNQNKIKVHVKTYWDPFEISDEELIRFWLKYLPRLPVTNFYRINRKRRTSKKIRKRNFPKKEGVLEIIVHSKKLGEEFSRVIQQTKKLSLRDKKVAVPFLRGIIASEGTVKIVNAKLREIRISSCNFNEQKYIRELLHFLKIIPSKARYKFYIAISGFKNFALCYKYKLFYLHPEKHSKFSIGFWNLFQRPPLGE